MGTRLGWGVQATNVTASAAAAALDLALDISFLHAIAFATGSMELGFEAQDLRLTPCAGSKRKRGGTVISA